MARLSTFFGKLLGGNEPATAPSARIAERTPEDLNAHVVALIGRECPGFSAADMNTPFDRLGIDSVGMLMIHSYIEETTGKTVEHREWQRVVTPADVVAVLSTAMSSDLRDSAVAANEQRSYALNMPQMAVSGLSESWLFKELGDMHWSVLAKGLGSPAHKLQDSGGERIYATFTRIQVVYSTPLTQYRENERIDIDVRMSRFGAGLYFSDAAVKGDGKSIDAQLMSTFAKFGDRASNMSLLKGLPEVPPDCDIPVLSELPEFGRVYRARRDESFPGTIFECEYEITPPYDINGVGLLYFAAYPIINDICAARFAGRSLMTGFSTIRRDVCYFGNSNADDVLIYRLHEWSSDNGLVNMRSSISRKSDGSVIAHIATQKLRLDSTAAAPEPTELVDTRLRSHDLKTGNK
jgi:probable biosynthetic protein (TIGR04098 family)